MSPVFSALFIDRPRFAIVIALLITLAGLVALGRLPQAQFPDIIPPQVEISTRYPGANAEVVEQTVAQVIEAQMVGVDNMIYMKSASGSDGSYTLTVSFEVGTDPDINRINANNRVDLVKSRLPREVQRQGLEVRKKSSALLQLIPLYSPGGTYDPLFLSNYTHIHIIDNLKRMRGVGDVRLYGTDASMRVWLDRDPMIGLELTAEDVIAALGSQNLQAAAGRIGAQPMTDDPLFQVNVQAKGRLVSIEEFEQVVVRANPDGSFVRIRDIGRVELGATAADAFARYQGGETALIGIFKSPGANAVATTRAVAEEMARLAKAFPEDVAYAISYDTTRFVEAMIEEVIFTLRDALLLVAVVIVVLYPLLGNFRATLIPIMAVAVAIVGACAAMAVFGVSANTLSLLALVGIRVARKLPNNG